MNSFISLVSKMEKELLSSCKKGDGFINCAEELLRKTELCALFDEREIFDFYNKNQTHQTYKSDGFSHLNVTLFSNEFFSINIYFWRKKQVPLHSHPCSGVIKVLKGETLDLQCRFIQTKRIFDDVWQVQLVDESIHKYNEEDVFTFDDSINMGHIPFKIKGRNISLVIRSQNTTSTSAIFGYPLLRFDNLTVGDELLRSIGLVEQILISGHSITEPLNDLVSNFKISEILYFLYLERRKYTIKSEVVRSLENIIQNKYDFFSHTYQEIENRERNLLKKIIHLNSDVDEG